jgi:hypothetical protein
MSNQHTKKQNEAAEAAAQAKAEAEAAEKATRTLIRVRIYRLDGSIDEIVQALPKMLPGESFTATVTPANL